jgi:hypothetical protein
VIALQCRFMALFVIGDLSAIWSLVGESRHSSAPAPNGSVAFDPERSGVCIAAAVASDLFFKIVFK